MAYRFGRLTVRDPEFGSLELEGDGFAAAGEAIRLVLDPAVQKQLGLSDDAARAAEAIWRRYQQEVSADHDAAEDAAAGAPPVPRRRTDAEGALSRLLPAPAYRRLQELSWRIRGGDALLEEDVARALGLSAAQREELTRLAGENEEGSRELYRGMAGARVTEAAFRERARHHAEAASERLLAVLTPEQAKAFDVMRGAAARGET